MYLLAALSALCMCCLASQVTSNSAASAPERKHNNLQFTIQLSRITQLDYGQGPPDLRHLRMLSKEGAQAPDAMKVDISCDDSSSLY